MRFDEGSFADDLIARCRAFIRPHFWRSGPASRTCVLLPGHWIEPSRAGRTVQIAVPELAERVEETD